MDRKGSSKMEGGVTRAVADRGALGSISSATRPTEAEVVSPEAELRRHYLTEFLKVAPLSHALWRSCEALAFESIPLDAPILDLGCGFGEFAGIVMGHVEVGIDIDKRDLNQAVKRGTYLHVQWADATDLPFRSNAFSTVVSVSVLEHIDRAGQVIQEVSRVLKHGGLFVFTIPTPAMCDGLLISRVFRFLGLAPLAKPYVQLHRHVFKHVTLEPAEWWARQLQMAGLELVSVQGTVSRRLLLLHELFLVFALPSQLWRVVSGKRLVMFPRLRSTLLSPLFAPFANQDPVSDINLIIVAEKP